MDSLGRRLTDGCVAKRGELQTTNGTAATSAFAQIRASELASRATGAAAALSPPGQSDHRLPLRAAVDRKQKSRLAGAEPARMPRVRECGSERRARRRAWSSSNSALRSSVPYSAELGIRFAPPIPPRRLVKRRFTDQLLVRPGIRCQRTLEESVEEQASVARASAVETEGELVEVVVQLRVTDRSLVSAEDPPLDQRGDEVHMRESNVSRGASGRDVGHDVREAVAADVVIAGPGVGADFAAARDVVEHELSQRVALDVGDPSHPHPLGRLVALDGDRDDRLVPRAAPADARMPRPYVCFVDLDRASEQLAA